jgi:hypothetical protein
VSQTGREKTLARRARVRDGECDIFFPVDEIEFKFDRSHRPKMSSPLKESLSGAFPASSASDRPQNRKGQTSHETSFRQFSDDDGEATASTVFVAAAPLDDRRNNRSTSRSESIQYP